MEQKITLCLKKYDRLEELDSDDKELLVRAREAAAKAYSPYSKFKVGAAVRLEDGTIVVGNNQENAVFPVGLCAERVAIFSAQATHPDVPITAIAVTAMGSESVISTPVPPCGSCRQVMVEAEKRFHRDLRVIMQGQEGCILVSDKMENLLPLAFADDFLKKYT
ncbi:MAG: cytidine deaminase [Candidatus Limimorpha sp.]